ncbi:MAG: hypothetical protein D6712_04660 [Chloroflexi bacterium]|nr:MAG: hypothetical protein D6712_04660 [Chloroflexota bacterium]
MPARFLHLVRHGHYEADAEDALGGGLTDLGREQAKRVAEALSPLKINAIYSSSLRRARETAEIIAAKCGDQEVQLSTLLWECVPTIPPRWAAIMAELAKQDPDYAPEQIAEDRKRADRAFQQYFRPTNSGDDVHEVLVAHGNIIRYLLTRALDVDEHAWSRMVAYHCSISRVLVEADGQMLVVGLNDVGHLPFEMHSDQ